MWGLKEAQVLSPGDKIQRGFLLGVTQLKGAEPLEAKARSPRDVRVTWGLVATPSNPCSPPSQQGGWPGPAWLKPTHPSPSSSPTAPISSLRNHKQTTPSHRQDLRRTSLCPHPAPHPGLISLFKSDVATRLSNRKNCKNERDGV